MTTRKSSAWLALLISFLIAVPPAVLADDTELFTTSANPNVLLILDVSGSMNTVAGTSSVGDLDGEGNTNSRLDVLWKVVYTLLNADLSQPSHDNGTTVTVGGTLYQAKRTDRTTLSTSISNSSGRYYEYVILRNVTTSEWSQFPGGTSSGGTVQIGSGGQSESMTYDHKSAGSPYTLYFSPAKHFNNSYNQGSTISYTYTTGGGGTVLYPQNYPTSNTEAVSADFLNNLTAADEEILKARLGLMTFSGSLSSTYRIRTWNSISPTSPNAPPFTPSYREIWDNVATNAHIDAYTPTAQALYSAQNFFNTAYNPNEVCRPNFAVLITDGEDTMGGRDGAPSGTADYYSGSYFWADGCTSWSGSSCRTGYGEGQVARHNAVIHEAANLLSFNPTVKLFTVGVGISGTDADLKVQREVLRRAAEQTNLQSTVAEFNTVGATNDCTARGAGRAFFATDANDLAVALRNVFHQISLGMYSFTAPTVASVRMTDRNYLYKASFSPAAPPSTFWEGSLQAYTLNADNTTTLLWDDNTVLASTSASSRRIYTGALSGGAWSRLDFTTSNIDNNMLGVSNSTVSDNVVNYIRGEGRTAKLGDIFHSKPVVVGPPSRFFFDEGYSTAVGGTSFVEDKATRKRVVYVGTNDGMLHGFLSGTWHDNIPTGYYDTGTGAEMFGYVPTTLLDQLENFLPADLTTHGYYVDSSPRVADVWIDNNANGTKESSEWKTVLISGMRKGGNGYFALDVTDPSSGAGIGTESANYPKVLWEYADATHVGETWSEPFIGKVKVTTGSTTRDRWVAIFGGGVGDGGVGRSVVVLDIATGAALKTFTSGIDNVIPASPTAVLDGNGYIKFAYAADLDGSVYKFDFRTPGIVGSYSAPAVTGTEWTMNKIFQAGAGQPVYHRVEPGTIDDTTRYLFFGTGNQESPVSDGGTGKFYAVKDSDSSATLIQENNLANLTSNLATGTAAPTQYGWYVILDNIVNSTANAVDTYTHHAEKVLSDPVVFFNNVYFSTFTPNAADPCNGGGIARVYGINMLNANSGLAALSERGESSASGKVAYHVYSGNPEGGIPSSPSLSIYPNGQSSIFIGFSTGAVKEIKIESPVHMKLIKSWKEIF